MRINLFKSIVLSLCSLSGAGYASSKEITTEAYVNAIYSATRQAWPVLENVWDTQVYRNLRLIVADDHNAWAIDSKSIIKIPYSEVQRRNLPVEYSSFQEVKWSDGRPTIYVGLGANLPPEEEIRFQKETAPVPMIFNIATHEAFHYFVQTNGWKKLSPHTEARATSYPVDATPRFYRNSILRALYASLQGDTSGLGHARYWYEKWKKLYPEDASSVRQADISEGTARYIENAAEIIAQGKAFNSSEFQHIFMKKMEVDTHLIYTSSDSESYPIGDISGYIMNLKKLKWHLSVMQGTPPLEILLGSVSSIDQPADKKLETEVSQTVEKINSHIGPLIEDFVRAYNDPNVVKIYVHSRLCESYHTSEGFFRSKAVPHDLIVGLNSSIKWENGSYLIKEAVGAVISNIPDYKTEHGVMILFNGKIPPTQNGRLVLKTEKIALNIPYPSDLGKTHVIHLR